ncbi:MAG: acyl-CoA ligase (AMP-forming), exosortase A system-associated [Parvularculaceae bacterium]
MQFATIAQFVEETASRTPDAIALIDGRKRITYSTLFDMIRNLASALVEKGLCRHDRVAVILDNSVEAAITILAVTSAGLIAVPVNTKLKLQQLHYIIDHCGAAALVTSAFRYRQLSEAGDVEHLQLILTTGETPSMPIVGPFSLFWELVHRPSAEPAYHRCIDIDPAAILYTSGSTGMPKGVTLSHRNLVSSAQSVNAYFKTQSCDVILCLLPLYFDAGLSQLTSGLAAGASIVLHSYIRPAEVVTLCEREKVSIITGVPPLWHQLMSARWSDAASQSVRTVANTGGHMYGSLLAKIRHAFPEAKPLLMYGLTEAFRSTYLDPSEIDKRPGSIGKALPNVEVLLLNEDGEPCQPDEPGELVHRGSLVALGYWNDPEKTAKRFRPLNLSPAKGLLTEIAVWSGDIIKKDAEGFLYFIGRNDELLKSSGFRISPTEVETILLAAPNVQEAVVFGLPDKILGQKIIAAVSLSGGPAAAKEVRAYCVQNMPSYMVPEIFPLQSLPRLGNGKIDRSSLPALYLNDLDAKAS